MSSPIQLPIDDVVPEILRALAHSRCLVIEAPPGAGKTTRVPLLLLEHMPDDGEIWVLQPRRIAARMAARRVAALLGEAVGQRCGYQVRFESNVSKATRIRFLTEGLLLKHLLDNPHLRGVRTVILDEFHERHLDGDLALMLLRNLQLGERPDLRIVVMSATMDAEHVCAYFRPETCANLCSEGRSYPVEITYQSSPRNRELSLESRVLRALHGLLEPVRGQPIAGHVLIFLPGAREIQQCAEACAGLAQHHGFTVHRLHGEMPASEQDRAVGKSSTYKIILSTNVAETSVTIDGVVAVIDSGLHRQASHDPWTGLRTLELRPISQASAAQRAGRAGRTRAGSCVRLYSQHDHDRRPGFDRPEVLRTDLTGALLTLKGFAAFQTLRWLDPPLEASIAHAHDLLLQIGAVAASGQLTQVGERMRRLPLHPRLGRVLVAGAQHGIADLAAQAVALLSERSIYTAAARRRPARREAACDLLNEIDDLQQAKRRGSGRQELVPEACARVRKVARQLEKIVHTFTSGENVEPSRDERDNALCLALLTAFPDRVAEVRRDDRGDRTVAFCNGGHAQLGRNSAIGDARLVVALSVEQRREGAHSRAVVSRAAVVEPEWLLDLWPDALRDETSLRFDPQRERIEGVSELRFGNAVIDRSRLQNLPPEAGSMLARAARDYGLDRLVDPPGALTQLQRRLQLAVTHLQDVDTIFLAPAGTLSDPAQRLDNLIARTLDEMCAGLRSFAEVRAADLLAHVRGQLDDQRLQRLCPTHIAVPGRRRVPVHYEADRPPWIESRLQDFFSLDHGPKIVDGRVSLVLHLLAPNRRAVQVTTDLAGFWQRHYPDLRRTLMRRYPRHAWPEDPVTARPPERGHRRK